MPDQTATAGRGVIFIALAKLYFMIAGYAIYFVLPRLLHSEVAWGNYLLVIGLVSVIDNVIVTATIQAVSKFTAEDESRADGVKRAALRMQLLLGGGLAAAYVAAAPLVARWERDASLTPLYQLSAGIMLCYSFYAVFVGSFNGLRRFGGQATLDISFSTLRAALILGGAAAGLGVYGAVGGFVVAAAIILCVSVAWVKLPRSGGEPFPAKRLWSLMAGLFVYTLALNLIMRVDLFLLKRYATLLSDAATAQARAEVASAFAAYYGTAQSLAFIPYQAILAVAFVVFPLVSRSTFENDLGATQAYIRQTLRLSLIFVAGVAVVFMANPEAVLNVPYQAKYRIGGEALRILAGGMVCFSMFTIINTIFNGAGRTAPAILSGLVTLGAATLGNVLLVPRAGSLVAALTVAAAATSAAMLLGAVTSAVLLHRAFKATFAALSLIRIAAAMGVALAVGHYLPERSRLWTLGECVLVLAVYLLTLIILRELGGEDLARVRKVLGRRR